MKGRRLAISRIKSKIKPKISFTFIILAAAALLFLTPLAVSITNSFMSEADISLNYSGKLSAFDIIDGVTKKFTAFKLIPDEATIAQYAEVLINQPSFMILMGNSVKIAAPVVILGLIVSLLSAYGFTVWKYKHKERLFFIYIVVMLTPLQATLVPNYIIADLLNYKDSPLYLAIILPGIFSPFGTFLLRQSMKSIPDAAYEAARIDGAGELKIFWEIVVPQMKSGVAAFVMLTFIEYWNIVEQAVIFIKDYYREPLSVYLSRIAEGRIAIAFAASVVYMAPPLLTLALGREDLEKGIELSGVK